MSVTLIPDHLTSDVNAQVCIKNQSAAGPKVFTACKMFDFWKQILQPALVRILPGSPITICELKTVRCLMATCQDHWHASYSLSHMLASVNKAVAHTVWT